MFARGSLKAKTTYYKEISQSIQAFFQKLIFFHIHLAPKETKGCKYAMLGIFAVTLSMNITAMLFVMVSNALVCIKEMIICRFFNMNGVAPSHCG